MKKNMDQLKPITHINLIEHQSMLTMKADIYASK